MPPARYSSCTSKEFILQTNVFEKINHEFQRLEMDFADWRTKGFEKVGPLILLNGKSKLRVILSNDLLTFS